MTLTRLADGINRAAAQCILAAARAIVTLALATLATCGALASAGAQTPTITEYPLPTSAEQYCNGADYPDGITTGPDGNLWFNSYEQQIGSITTAGAATLYVDYIWNFPDNQGPMDTCSHGWGIVTGSDGALYYTLRTDTQWWQNSYTYWAIGRVTTAGATGAFALPADDALYNTCYLWDIVSGPDGALWFTLRPGGSCPGAIGRMTTSGQFTIFPVPWSNSYPVGITVGPDGALWFADPGTAGGTPRIGRITTAGQFSSVVTILPPNSGSTYAFSTYITAGPDGALWFTTNSSRIGRITVAGAIRWFNLQCCGPYTGGAAIVTGPEGALWFTDPGDNLIWQLTTAGTFTSYAVPSSANYGFSPEGITVGSNGDLWFSLSGGYPDVSGQIGTMPATASANVLLVSGGSIGASGEAFRGPFSPSSFGYSLSASVGSGSSGSQTWSLSGVPNWLTPSASSGTATNTPSPLTFTVNANANKLPVGVYNATITFIAGSGQGTQTRMATLTVLGAPQCSSGVICPALRLSP